MIGLIGLVAFTALAWLILTGLEKVVAAVTGSEWYVQYRDHKFLKDWHRLIG